MSYEDYAKYVRKPDGTYEVIKAKSGLFLAGRLTLLEAAAEVRKINERKKHA